MHCTNHPRRPSRFVCPDCGSHFCDDCVKIRIFGSKKIQSCPTCTSALIEFAPPDKHSILSRIKNLLPGSGKRDIRPPERIMLDEARLARRRREHRQAVILYNQALSFMPSMPHALEELYYLLVEMGDAVAAVRTGSELIEHYIKSKDQKSAIGIYRMLIKSDPSLDLGPQTLWTMGQWFHDGRHFAESATVFRKLGVLHPAHDLAAHALYRSAFILHVELGHNDQAKKIYQYVIEHYDETEWATRSHQGIARLLEE